MIWEIVAFQRRHFEVFRVSGTQVTKSDPNSGVALPSILLVDHESRNVALKHYQRVKEISTRTLRSVRLSESASQGIALANTLPLRQRSDLIITKAQRTIWVNFQADNFTLKRGIQAVSQPSWAEDSRKLNFLQDTVKEIQNCTLKRVPVCPTAALSFWNTVGSCTRTIA